MCFMLLTWVLRLAAMGCLTLRRSILIMTIQLQEFQKEILQQIVLALCLQGGMEWGHDST